MSQPDKNFRANGPIFLYFLVDKGYRMKIDEIKKILKAEPSEDFLKELELDSRRGVQNLLQAYYKREQSKLTEKLRFEQMLRFERKYFEQGLKYIAGVDEAGRGPLAGPLVVAAVILPQDIFISGLNDSKQLSASKREQLYDEICAKAIAIAVQIVAVSDIDQYNIYQATQLSMKAVLKFLNPKPEIALVDAMPIVIQDMKIESLIHGDALSVSIAAASIIAKVTRDRLMIEVDEDYPQYGFAQHKGYGSKSHMDAIAKYGVTPWHRRSYEPIKSMKLAKEEKTAGLTSIYRLK